MSDLLHTCMNCGDYYDDFCLLNLDSEYSPFFCDCGNELHFRDDGSITECNHCLPDRTTGAFKNA